VAADRGGPIRGHVPPHRARRGDRAAETPQLTLSAARAGTVFPPPICPPPRLLRPATVPDAKKEAPMAPTLTPRTALARAPPTARPRPAPAGGPSERPLLPTPPSGPNGGQA